MREHRLYQADWLMRYYDFSLDEIVSAAPGGMFDAAIDPKLAWALANRAHFPVDVNVAPREMLLRVPGLGARAVQKILSQRRYQALRLADLARVTVSAKKALPFIVAHDWSPGGALDDARLESRFCAPPKQLELFAA